MRECARERCCADGQPTSSYARLPRARADQKLASSKEQLEIQMQADAATARDLETRLKKDISAKDAEIAEAKRTLAQAEKAMAQAKTDLAAKQHELTEAHEKTAKLETAVATLENDKTASDAAKHELALQLQAAKDAESKLQGSFDSAASEAEQREISLRAEATRLQMTLDKQQELAANLAREKEEARLLLVQEQQARDAAAAREVQQRASANAQVSECQSTKLDDAARLAELKRGFLVTKIPRTSLFGSHATTLRLTHDCAKLAWAKADGATGIFPAATVAGAIVAGSASGNCITMTYEAASTANNAPAKNKGAPPLAQVHDTLKVCARAPDNGADRSVVVPLPAAATELADLASSLARYLNNPPIGLACAGLALKSSRA